MRKLVFLVFWGLLASFAAQAQNQEKEPGVVTGNVSLLWQSYQEDTLIGAVVPPSKT